MNIMLDKGAFAPEYAHFTDAGADLRSPIDILIPAREARTIDTGVHIELPECLTAFVKSRSSLFSKFNLSCEGVIDEGYTGSIGVTLMNHSITPYYIRRGDKIAQLVILPVYHAEFTEVNSFAPTERGDGGFGSTGK